MGSKVSKHQQHGPMQKFMEFPLPRLKCGSSGKLIHKLNDDKYVHLRSAISKTEDKMRNMIFSSFIELFLCILWRSQYLIQRDVNVYYKRPLQSDLYSVVTL